MAVPVKYNIRTGNYPIPFYSAFYPFKTRFYFEREASFMSEKNEFTENLIFPMGGENTAYADYFVGKSYLDMLSTQQVVIGNVTFEPGCRNNWHIHHAKKGGGGYYQEWGKEPRELHPGDVVNIPPEVKHWHGAAPDFWFSHIAIEVPGEETSNQWCEPVSDEEYGKLK